MIRKIENPRGATPDGPLVVEYERFLRHRSRDALKLTLRAESDTVELRVDSRYIRRVEIEAVTPRPVRVVAASDFQAYVFMRCPAARQSRPALSGPGVFPARRSWEA